MKKLAIVLGMLLSLKANATGGFWCEYKDDSLNFELSGVTTRSFENDIVDANAWLMGTMGDDGLIFKADQNFVKTDVRQYWNNGNEFRILLYAEDEAANKNTKVTITTKDSGVGITFSGTISIHQSQPTGVWSIEEAPISCGLE